MNALKKYKALLLCFMSLLFMAGMCEEDPYVDNVLVNSIWLDYSNVELRVGEELTLTATVSPQNATKKSLSWRSHNENIAIVDAIDADKAVVTAQSPGTAIITATAKDGSGVTATCVITVIENDSEPGSGDSETQWSEWTEFATAQYELTVLWEGTLSDITVYRRESLNDPTKQQFAFQNHPGYEMIINYDATTNRCHVEVTYTNYEHSSYGSIYVADTETFMELHPDFTGEVLPSTFDPETGLFSLHLVYFVSEGTWTPGYEYLQLDGYTQPDYSLRTEYLGYDGNIASFYIAKGYDVATYRCAVKPGTLEQEEALAMAWEIVNGEISYTESTESDYHNFYLSETGEYTFVAVSFDATGEPRKYAWYNFEISSGSPWQSLGMATYREDLMTTFYNVDNLTYAVEIEANTENPGLYRLVNPYGAAYPYNDEGEYDTSENHYMVIDAQNPEAVTIQQTYTGMNWGYGEVFVWSLADYYLNQGSTAEEIAEAGYFGKLEDGVITFPTKALIISMAELENGGLYYANENGKFAVALPGYSIPDYYAAAPAQRTTKQIDKKNVTSNGPSLKRHSANMGVITKSIKINNLDIIR